MTLIPTLTFTELRVVSMEHRQRVLHASRERLPLRTPGSVPFFGACMCSDCWDQITRLYTDLMTELNLTFAELRGFHGAVATGVACQQGALTLPDTWFRPPFRDLLMLQLLRPNSSNLPCLYSTFHLEYPLVLSRFSFDWSMTRLGVPIDNMTRLVIFFYSNFDQISDLFGGRKNPNDILW